MQIYFFSWENDFASWFFFQIELKKNPLMITKYKQGWKKDEKRKEGKNEMKKGIEKEKWEKFFLTVQQNEKKNKIRRRIEEGGEKVSNFLTLTGFLASGYLVFFFLLFPIRFFFLLESSIF